MKYNKIVISALVLSIVFSGSCLIAAYTINNSSKYSMAKPFANKDVKDGLKSRIENLQKQSLLELNQLSKVAFNESLFLPTRAYFDNFEKELDRILDDNRKEIYELNSKAVGISNFMVDNTDKHFKVSALTQNVTKEMLNVEVHKGFLTVSAQEKTEDKAAKDKEETKQKFVSSFKKIIKLPENVDAKKAEISFKENHLIITFPKTELKEDKPLKLEIK